MINGVLLLNLAIGIAGLFLCLFSILHIQIGLSVDKTVGRYFLLFFSVLSLYVLSNFIGILLRGTPGEAARIILRITNFGEYFLPCLLAYIMSVYLMSIVDPRHEKKYLRSFMILLVLVHTTLLVISQFTGLYYTIGADNVYHRSTLYPVSYILPMMLMSIDMFYLIAEREKFTGKEETAFWIYILVPSLAVVVQIFVYGIYFVIFATVIAAFAMYLFILESNRERQLNQIREISQLKTDVLISQVQPHFIFNSLTAIRSLCDMDSEAYEAIGHFAGFLRGSIEMLNEKSCIPMKREIETVDSYLYMEKLRFEDKLEIVRDFRDTAFMLPSCSLQILTENAVKHGIRNNPEGKGTLLMRSYENEKFHIVEVLDNGVGFDPDKHTGGTGINNLRRRLEIMCGGELRISSEKGRGTLAQIFIPKA